MTKLSHIARLLHQTTQVHFYDANRRIAHSQFRRLTDEGMIVLASGKQISARKVVRLAEKDKTTFIAS